MGQTVDYEVVGSYNNQRISSIDAERSVNMFEYIDPLGKKKRTLINTSGLTNTSIVYPGGTPTDGYRAQFVFNNVEYDVIGNGGNSEVYSITTSGIIAHIGTITGTFTGYVGVCANTFQIFFVDGQHGYIWDTISLKFEVITDPAFPAFPLDCTYLDGFFIVTDGGTNGFQLSSYNQGLIWGPDNNGTETTFSMTGSTITLTFSSSGGVIGSYQIGTPVTFNGGSIPSELTAGTVYYVVANDGTSVIKVSATDGGTAITSAMGGSGNITNSGQLQQAFMTSDTGTIVACRVLHRRLFLFSQFFTEVWENAGAGTNLPFRRNNSLLMQYGTPCVGSIAVSFDMMVFISQSRKGLGPVMQINGVQPVPISNRALDFQLSQYAATPIGTSQLSQITDCIAFLIKENGLVFYRMNFTSANHTFVYNVNLSSPEIEEGKLWHEEEVLNGDRHPAQTSCYLNGINYVGNYKNSNRYILDSNNYTNDSEAIRRMRITRAVVPPGYQRIRIDRLQLDLLQGNIADLMDSTSELDILTENNFNILTETGFDIATEQGITTQNPTNLFVFMSISKDGGQTYGYSVSAPMGFVGQRTFRTLWRKLGVIPRGQAFVVKFEFYQAVPFVILGASWAMEVLPE
jgi:hypothetical protein